MLAHLFFDLQAIRFRLVRCLRGGIGYRPVPIGVRSLRRGVEATAIDRSTGTSVVKGNVLPVQRPSHAGAEVRPWNAVASFYRAFRRFGLDQMAVERGLLGLPLLIAIAAKIALDLPLVSQPA